MATFSYILCTCCDSSREELVDFIHIWYSNQVPYFANACKICGSMPDLSNYANIFLKFYVFCNISEKNVFMLFIFGTVINHNRDMMYVKYTMALCQNVLGTVIN